MTAKKPNNLDLWNRVEKTDPRNTKPVKLGRAFTAIDPHSQVKAMTEEFGPAGVGWGWEVLRVEYTTTNNIAMLIGLWIAPRLEGNPGIQQWGENSLYIDNKEQRKDIDAFKKATTDGLTKSISYLGFNADVFLGKFDDNKYVTSVDNEFRGREKENAAKGNKAKADAIIKNLQDADSREAIEKIKNGARETVQEIAKTDKGLAQQIATEAQKAMSQFPDDLTE